MNLEIFEKEVLNKIAQADYNAALELIQQLVERVISNPLSIANVFGSRQLDELCLAIGQAVAGGKIIRQPSNEGCSVIVATELGAYGGHTHVIKDLIKAQPDMQHIILLTDVYNRVDIDSLLVGFKSIASIQRAPLGNAIEKLKWIIKSLAELRPAKIFLFNHHGDSVAIASVQPWLKAKKVFFYHHADHHLCLGVHLPNAVHIDPHNLGYYNCKTHEGITNNHYLPLVVEDRGTRSKKIGFIKGGNLRTCSSGTSPKFDSTYIYTYKDLISKRLMLRDGVHFHIGDLSTSMLEAVHQQLITEQVDPNRFIHIPWVPSLWAALIEHEIDVYINSFPLGGGRATIEVMGSGTPLMMHESCLSRFHGGVDIAYAEVLVWKKPADFYEQLLSLTPELLAKHSRESRMHYKKYHTFALMESQLFDISLGFEGVNPPELRVYVPDYFQRYLQLSTTHDEQIKDIVSSNSWRVTAPLRWVRDFLARFKSLKW